MEDVSHAVNALWLLIGLALTLPLPGDLWDDNHQADRDLPGTDPYPHGDERPASGIREWW